MIFSPGCSEQQTLTHKCCRENIREISVFHIGQTISLRIFKRLSSTNFTWFILENTVSLKKGFKNRSLLKISFLEYHKGR